MQISLLGSDGRFGRWRRLAPDFNGYDSTINDTISICQFDPGDDGLPPADDTMCDHSPMWADLGDLTGADPNCVIDTNNNDSAHKDCGAISSCTGGPGCTERGSIGTGVWARSAFDLSPFSGRQARLRWIASMGGGWSFGITRSLLEPEPSYELYDYYDVDDGWYIDDIVLTDLRQANLDCAEDSDMDGVSLCGDCTDSDATAWALPGEVVDLTFAADARTLSWSPPASPGSTALTYDLLRSNSRGDFWTAACLESNDGSNLTAVDAQSPSAGGVFYYLARARDNCPYGRSALGSSSAGVPHDGRGCP